MSEFLTKTEALNLKKIAFPKKVHYVCEFYPEIFDEDEGVEFYEDMEFEAGVFELKSFRLKSNCFPKIKCPVCGKEESIVYSCVASMLSGVHTLKFHCLNCHESISEIAGSCRCGEGKVKSSLFRTRNNLRKAMEKEGMTI